MRYALTKGILIAIEGIDGSGKSTFCANLVKKLTPLFSVVQTREPGSTIFGQHVRAIVQQPIPRCAQAEFLLFAADRAQHFTEIIAPELLQKKLIISDRMADSSLIYQGYGRGLDIGMIQKINQWAMHNHTPDLTFYVRIDLKTASERIIRRNKALTAFEQEDAIFTQKLINGFDTLYKDRSDVIQLDGTLSPEIIATDAYTQLMHYVQKKRYLYEQ